jgi:hypothetical protein
MAKTLKSRNLKKKTKKKNRILQTGDSPNTKDIDKMRNSYQTSEVFHQQKFHTCFKNLDMLKLMKLIDNRTIPPQNRPGGIGGKPSNSPSFLKSQYSFITKYGPIKIMPNGLQFQYKKKDGTWSRPLYPFCNSKQFGFNISKKKKTHINSPHKISGASRRIPEAFTTIKKISETLQASIKKNNPQLYKELQSISKKCKRQHLHFGLWTSCSVQLNMPSSYHYDKNNLEGIATIIAWSNNNQSGILAMPELKVGLKMNNTSITSGDFSKILHGNCKFNANNRVSLTFYCNPLAIS